MYPFKTLEELEAFLQQATQPQPIIEPDLTREEYARQIVLDDAVKCITDNARATDLVARRTR